MRLELPPNLNTRVDVFVGPNPDAPGPFYYWEFQVDPDAKFLQVVVIGAGGGGGSGRQGAAGTKRIGGQAGAGGGYLTGFYPAYMLNPDDILNVAAGTGGAGGIAVETPDTNGEPGARGGASLFGNLVQAVGGGGGDSGKTSTYNDGYRAASYYSPWPGGGGGVSGNVNQWHNGETALAGGGGGGGGWVDAADVVYGGGRSGPSIGLQNRTGFANAGQDGENQPENWPLPSSGGGGGNVGQRGGNGGAYGGGGGGGGASTNGDPSGAGGDGAPGIVIITSYF